MECSRLYIYIALYHVEIRSLPGCLQVIEQRRFPFNDVLNNDVFPFIMTVLDNDVFPVIIYWPLDLNFFFLYERLRNLLQVHNHKVKLG